MVLFVLLVHLIISVEYGRNRAHGQKPRQEGRLEGPHSLGQAKEDEVQRHRPGGRLLQHGGADTQGLQEAGNRDKTGPEGQSRDGPLFLDGERDEAERHT